MSTQPLPVFSVEKYLELERAAEFRSEFIGGQVVAMWGASLNHSWVLGNAHAALNSQLRGKPCGAVPNDLRIYIAPVGIFTYPDIAIVCGPPKFMDNRRDTTTDATVIIEVLSPSTRSYDRGDKFAYYRHLPSFCEYLLLRQDRIGAEYHRKQPDGSWLMREVNNPSATIQLTSVGCELSLSDLYDRVELSLRKEHAQHPGCRRVQPALWPVLYNQAEP